MDVNEGCVEGLIDKEKVIMLVEFHGEADGGGGESEWVLDDFIEKVKEGRREVGDG
ncbi:hypothetical protein [Bacillus altitudinis]|uniref:hypothetical protein n=1 Tax=Bacillus altitudinis TaxID=293387 RepID=UPI001643896E|nr:hypothetical protein [Bacillus altitudinis]